MIDHIYIEDDIADHFRTLEICSRFPQATLIRCERYTSVFNTNAQNFRIQKKSPSLILARKHRNRVTQTPQGYGIGGDRNFYFSHMLNCLYDCRYCFLQGMYRSAHYVVFVNYEDFLHDIKLEAKRSPEPVWFFSGYDCDSLAMEPVTGFIDYALDEFEELDNARIEIRTKSTQIRKLLNRSPNDRAVVAYSFTPNETSQALEHKTPSIAKRIAAMRKLQQHGWNVGLRLDPLIHTQYFEREYRQLLLHIFREIDQKKIHSVSYGPFRLPRDFYKKIVKLYPREKLFAASLTENGAMVSYETDVENRLQQYVHEELLRYIDSSIIFPCS